MMVNAPKAGANWHDCADAHFIAEVLRVPLVFSGLFAVSRP
jgi:hypothetical protein